MYTKVNVSPRQVDLVPYIVDLLAAMCYQKASMRRSSTHFHFFKSPFAQSPMPTDEEIKKELSLAIDHIPIIHRASDIVLTHHRRDSKIKIRYSLGQDGYRIKNVALALDLTKEIPENFQNAINKICSYLSTHGRGRVATRISIGKLAIDAMQEKGIERLQMHKDIYSLG